MTASDGQAVPFSYDEASTSLEGWWGPTEGFDIAPLYNVTTLFTATVPDGTAGSYDVAPDLVDLDLLVSDPGNAVLASDSAILTVVDNVQTVTWAGDVPEIAAQGSQIMLPLSVYALADAEATLGLTISMDDPETTDTAPDPLVASNVRVYARTADSMVPLGLSDTDEDGVLTATSCR